MGKEKEKDKSKDKEKKEKKEKSKDEKKDKEKKSKDKDKEKKEKKKSEKDKKVKKDKKDEKEEKGKLESEWALVVSKQLDNIIVAYEKIVKKFQDLDNYILPDSSSKEDFIEKVKKSISDLPEPSQNIFLVFLDSLP